MDFQVLIFYKYVHVDDPQEVRDSQIKLCEKLNIKGRIIIASEGINGTLEGTTTDTEKYISAMQKIKIFKDINFKKSLGTGKAFPKLSVKVRPEIVAVRLYDLDPNQVSGKYIDADKLHSWFEERKQFYIVDMRNDYEYQSGYFENSLLSGIHNFFDLPDVLPKIKHLKDETIVTVCTAGVRCEKASGFLLQSGFKDVYQLKDGIQTYMEKYPNQHFKGKLYVFDNRLTLGFNIDSPEHQIVGKCLHCGGSSDNYVNCPYDFCHFHYICCKDCLDKTQAFCKKDCQKEYFFTKNPARPDFL